VRYIRAYMIYEHPHIMIFSCSWYQWLTW